MPLGESADTAGTLQTFKAVADNPLTGNVLRALSKHCPKDKGNRLEVFWKQLQAELKTDLSAEDAADGEESFSIKGK